MRKSLILLGIVATGCSTSLRTPQSTQSTSEPTPAVIAAADPVDAEPTADGLVVLRLPGMT